MLYCSINGKQTNQLSVKDRSISYGDGLFTTGKITNGNIEMLPLHINRLRQGCIKLKIEQPNLNELNDELQEIARCYNKAVIKIVITAGEGGRGYSRIGTSSPTIIISVSAFPERYELWQQNGINLGVSSLQLGISPMLSGIKHLNRLEQVLIRQELDNRAEDDLLVTNIYGHVIETSCANLFWLIDDQIYTPDISHSGVAGLVRDKILANIPNVRLGDFILTDVEKAQAMFICNSVMGIVPVKTFNGKLLSLEKLSGIQSVK
ncbi:MAG: aminodeoxychorismate lyase [Colwellia sp.]|nr:aminodeoxychorismate lyase [Colwellia sp.]